MISVLIKKQIYEVYSFLFYDSRKGKKRMGAGKIGYWLLLLSLFGFLMGAFSCFLCIWEVHYLLRI